MLFDNDDHKKAMSAAMALSSRFRASSGVLLACAGGLQSMTHISSAPTATAEAQAKTKIPIIVKDTFAFAFP